MSLAASIGATKNIAWTGAHILHHVVLSKMVRNVVMMAFEWILQVHGRWNVQLMRHCLLRWIEEVLVLSDTYRLGCRVITVLVNGLSFGGQLHE